MHPALYRASGHDFANLWMNMAKTIIALVFLYQNVLDTQLGVKFFAKDYYVFVPSSRTQVVTPDAPHFSVAYKPLTLGKKYDEFVVEVLAIKSDGQNLVNAGPQCRDTTSWDSLNTGNRTGLDHAEFSFMELIDPTISPISGDYDIEFGFTFVRDGRRVGEREDAHHHEGTVHFENKETLPFGDYPVVQGRSFPMPTGLSTRLQATNASFGGWIDWTWDDGSGGTTSRGPFAGSVLRMNGSLLEVENTDLAVDGASLTAGRNYRQRGFFLDPRGRHEFTIGFNVLPNQQARPTYGNADADSVVVYYDWALYEPVESYYYFNLSFFVIDPDGIGAGNRPEVRVREFRDLRASTPAYDPVVLPYEIVHHDSTGDWHLKITGTSYEDLMLPNERHDLMLTAVDDFSRRRIKVKIWRI